MRRKEIAAAVCRIVSAVSGWSRRSFSEDTFLREGIGLDSLDVLEIVEQCEKEFGVTLLSCDIKGLRTVDNIIDLVYETVQKGGQKDE
jgi:acyl carrier protein